VLKPAANTITDHRRNGGAVEEAALEMGATRDGSAVTFASMIFE